MKNYYRILGVLDDAEDVVIRAAYKALAQRYHPDKWKGSADEANQKMAEINEAYATLSDAQKRRAYDDTFFQQSPRNDAEHVNDEGMDDFEGEDVETWKMAVEFFPNLELQYAELRKISHALANTFRIHLVEAKDFKNSEAIKEKFEYDHLKKYYGDDAHIRRFARRLLVSGYQHAAIELNKIVRYMGETVTLEQIKKRIFDKYPEAKSVENVTSAKSMDSIYTKALNNDIDKFDAIRIIEYTLGTHVRTEVGFWSVSYIFSKDGVITELKNDTELIEYAINIAKTGARSK